MLHKPFYDPEKSYKYNFEKGPFGSFSDEEVFENKGEPKFNFFGTPVFSPFGIPAGPLVNGKFARAALRKGFDIVTYKTVRSSEYPSHQWPNVLPVKAEGELTFGEAGKGIKVKKDYEEPLSITNSFGVPSLDPDFWVKDISDLTKNIGKGQAVVGAFQGTKKEKQTKQEYINDFVKTAKLLKKTGVNAIEVNLSCPNEGTDSLLCYDQVKSVEVAKAVKEEIGDIPFIVKIGYFEEEVMLEEFVTNISSFVDGISAINTIPAKILDSEGGQALPGEGRLRSGVCGSAIKWAGIDMVSRLHRIREKVGKPYSIIGVGGVFSFEDFFQYRKAGADFVMSATGSMWNPCLAQEIKGKL